MQKEVKKSLKSHNTSLQTGEEDSAKLKTTESESVYPEYGEKTKRQSDWTSIFFIIIGLLFLIAMVSDK